MAKELDNIEMDMIEAERLGYGVQYGRYKADYPFTKEANEERRKRKPKTKPVQIYVFNCPVCGKEFTTSRRNKKYCSEYCKERRGSAAENPKNEK